MRRREFVAGFGFIGILGPHVTWAAVKGKLLAEGVRLNYRVLFSDS